VCCETELGMRRELPMVNLRGEIVGAHHPRLAEHGEDRSGAKSQIARLTAASTGNPLLISEGFLIAQQLGESRRSGLMQGAAQGHLHRLEISSAGLAAFAHNPAHPAPYPPLAPSLYLTSRLL